MAIGVEQLDIKNIAKIFLLRDHLGSEIASDDFKDYIKAALESFTEEDWDKIRENIFPSSDEKKALRAIIDEVKELLSKSEAGIFPGQYPVHSVNVLSSAVSNAESIIRNQKDETIEEKELMILTRALLLNARNRFLSSVITEDGRLANDTCWYGSKKALGWKKEEDDRGNVKVISKYDWVPAKIINNTYYVSLEPIPDNYFGRNNYTYIRGLWLIAEGKEIVITRDQFPTNLGVEVVEGVIFNDYLFAVDEDLKYAPLISSYLGRPINIAPCRFNGSLNNKTNTDTYIQYTISFADLFNESLFPADKKDEILQTIFKVEKLDCTENLYSKSRSYATAKPNTNLYVDNENNVITGVGHFTADLGEFIKTQLCFADKSKITVDIDIDDRVIDEEPKVTNITIGVQSENNYTTHIFTLCEDLVLVDSEAETIDGKYYSKYHPVDKSLDWIPTYVIDNKYYISPEPIDEKHTLYNSNKNLIHIVGVFDEQTGHIYTRHILDETHELTNPKGKYSLSLIKGGLYNGYWFGSSQLHANQLSNYVKYMSVYKNGNLGGDFATGFVSSLFTEYVHGGNIDSIEKEYFWEGNEINITKLPDKRSLCKFYLNVIAIRTSKEDPNQQ